MKTTFLLAFTIFCHTLFAQTPQQYKQIGWAVAYPEDLEPADATTVAASTLKGKDAYEQGLVKKYGLDKTENLLSLSKGKYNFFTSSLGASPLVTAQNFADADLAAKLVFFHSFSTQIPFIKIDSSMSVQKIDGIEFNKFQATCYINFNTIFNAVHLGTFYKGRYFSISYYYMDNSTGEQMEEMLRKSTLAK